MMVSKMRMNKRGFQLVMSTVVVMILAIMLLIFFVLFFTMGSSGFVQEIKSYFSYSNVDSVIKGCNVLVDSGSSYEYCCGERNVKYYLEGDKSEGVFSCKDLADREFINGEIRGLNCEGGC